MTLLSLVFALVVIGVVLWLINEFIPMQPKIKTLMNVLVIVFLVLWLLSQLGFLTALNVPLRIR